MASVQESRLKRPVEKKWQSGSHSPCHSKSIRPNNHPYPLLPSPELELSWLSGTLMHLVDRAHGQPLSLGEKLGDGLPKAVLEVRLKHLDVSISVHV